MNQRQKRAVGVTVAVGIAIIVLIILVTTRWVCGGITAGSEHVACVRDMAIIILMLETFVAVVLVAVMVVLVAMLTVTVQEKVVPILEAAQGTANTVQTTTTFVSDTVVTPIIRVHETMSGIRGFLLALFAVRKKKPEPEADAPSATPKEAVK